MNLPDGWLELNGEKAVQVRAALEREMGSGHILADKTVTAIARRVDRDDFLFQIFEGGFALVHLAFTPPTSSAWPHTRIFADFDEWLGATATGDNLPET